MKGRQTAQDDSAPSPKRRASPGRGYAGRRRGRGRASADPMRPTRGRTWPGGPGRAVPERTQATATPVAPDGPATTTKNSSAYDVGGDGNKPKGDAAAMGASTDMPKLLNRSRCRNSGRGPGRESPGRRVQGGRPAPWAMGCRGVPKSPLVVSMRESMVQGSKGGTRLWSQVQRRSRWSGWGLGEGQERPSKAR
jgi:hypothetical protein